MKRGEEKGEKKEKLLKCVLLIRVPDLNRLPFAQVLIRKLPADLMRKWGTLFFVPLVAALVNDPSSECRDAVGITIRSLFQVRPSLSHPLLPRRLAIDAPTSNVSTERVWHGRVILVRRQGK